MKLKLLIISILILLLQCDRSTPNESEMLKFGTDHFMEIVSGNELYLRWNKPILDSTKLISNYGILYRPHGNQNWYVLQKYIPPYDSPYVCIRRNEIISNEQYFDFAVKAYLYDGDSTKATISTDSSLYYGGWYVNWLSPAN